MTKKDVIVQRGAERLLALCDEHGVPNGFHPFEVAHFSRIERMLVGRYAQDIAAEAMRQRPHLKIAYTKNRKYDRERHEYTYGRFSVDLSRRQTT